METLVVNQHRNQYYSRSRNHSTAQFGSPSRDLRGINCRGFQSEPGVLPSPLKAYNTSRGAFSLSPTLETPSSAANSHSDDGKYLKKAVRSSSILIPVNSKLNSNKEGPFCDEFSCSELWAGPAYSNSPPPSSLPMPKFSLQSRHTVSLDLLSEPLCINLHPIAKPPPASPTRELNNSPGNPFCSADSATQNLRRILNLDITD